MTQPNPNQQPWVRKTLRYCTNLMTVVCLIDATAEGLSQGTWHSDISIFPIYHFLLLTYSGTRAWQKWKKKDRQEDKIWGEKWMLAWVGVVFLLWLVDISMYPVYQPRHLYNTILWVFGVYAATKGPFLIRDFAPEEPVIEGDNQGTDDSAPVADDGPDPADNGQVMDKTEAMQLVRQACQQLGTFTFQDIMQRTGFSKATVTGQIGRLMQLGFIRKGDDDKFYWIGPPNETSGGNGAPQG